MPPAVPWMFQELSVGLPSLDIPRVCLSLRSFPVSSGPIPTKRFPILLLGTPEDAPNHVAANAFPITALVVSLEGGGVHPGRGSLGREVGQRPSLQALVAYGSPNPILPKPQASAGR